MKKKTTETKTIKVTRYYDSEENPTCMRNIQENEVCIFYRTQRFGTCEICILDPQITYLRRRKDSNQEEFGSLIPDNSCPIWAFPNQTRGKK
jgi:hypothetical protein